MLRGVGAHSVNLASTHHLSMFRVGSLMDHVQDSDDSAGARCTRGFSLGRSALSYRWRWQSRRLHEGYQSSPLARNPVPGDQECGSHAFPIIVPTVTDRTGLAKQVVMVRWRTRSWFDPRIVCPATRESWLTEQFEQFSRPCPQTVASVSVETPSPFFAQTE